MILHTFTNIDLASYKIIALSIAQQDTVVFLQDMPEQFTELNCTVLQLFDKNRADDPNSKNIVSRSEQSNNEPEKISMQEFSALTQQANKVINW